jgi:hypothetical protein
VNSWILAQYGITRQEVEGVTELDWLRMLLARGCPLDAFAYLVEYEYPEKLLKFIERREANDDELGSKLFNLMRPLRGSTNCYGNGIWHSCRTMRHSLRRSPNHFMFCVRMILASQTRRYAFKNSYRQVEGRMNDRSDTGRSIADCIYVVGYTPNGQYYTGFKDQREPVEQRSMSSRPSATDSVSGVDLTVLRTSLLQATLETYIETIRSMPRHTSWYQLVRIWLDTN